MKSFRPALLVVSCAAAPWLLVATACDQSAPSSPQAVAAAEKDAPAPDAPGRRGPSSTSPPPASSDQEQPAMSRQSSPRSPSPPIELRNRLGEETSPYLLQHKDNPVHWFAWGPEAFEAARALDRPIFLSIGYSTCYWCHVMERESFESEQVARVMNEHFVCIKVDREERPDVDDIYMAAVQITNQGRGGWPMSVFLEPAQLRPFLGATYFPADRFVQVLETVSAHWTERRPDVMRQAEQVAGAVRMQLANRQQPASIGRRDVERAMSQLLASYDRQHAGFGPAPKFPIPSTLDFLMAAGWSTEPVRRAVLHTLDRMATGGVYDQVGGGFHRYSTDEKWLVPHFEKMIYDNGQLASTYAEAFERSGDDFYGRVVRDILEYVLREMTSPRGAFYSAQDAEVNHREGQNYIWRADEVRGALAEAGLEGEIDFALKIYGLEGGTNFQDPHHPEDEPANVLALADRPDALAAAMGMELESFRERRRRVNEALLETRDRRDQPGLDDKILASWNGLMIAGMADGARVLDEPRFRRAAAEAADFVLASMRDGDGGLLRTARGGEARIDAFAEDYAGMIRGLVALHRSSRQQRYLDAAADLAAAARQRFWDDSAGGYYDTLAGQQDLLVRAKSSYDGAVPSANSLMAGNLLDLHELTGDESYLDDAVATLESISGVISERPTTAVLALAALHRLLEEHPGRLDGGAEATTAAAGRTPSLYESVEPVTFKAEPNTVRVAPGAPASFSVRLDIAKGFHVNAHKPGIDFLIPLKIALVGAEGLELEVDYPAGEQYDGPEGVMLVHHGAVTVPVRVRQTGPVSGRPRIMMTYQVCTDRECLAPETERVAVAIIGE